MTRKRVSPCEKASLITGAAMGIILRAGLSAAAIGITVSEILTRFEVAEDVERYYFRIGLVFGALIQAIPLMGGHAIQTKDIPDNASPRACWRIVTLGSDNPVGALQLACCGIFGGKKKKVEPLAKSSSTDVFIAI